MRQMRILIIGVLILVVNSCKLPAPPEFVKFHKSTFDLRGKNFISEFESFSDKKSKYLKKVQLPFKANSLLSSNFFHILKSRRSRRSLKSDSILLTELGAILYAAYGVTKKARFINFKTVPSAGAIYPLKFFLFVFNTKGLEKGVYLYQPHTHSILLLKKGNFKNFIYQVGLFQKPFINASLCIAIGVDFYKLYRVYGERGARYAYIEAGHAGQNIYLACEALNFATCEIGAFFDKPLNNFLDLNSEFQGILAIFPISPRN